jgi:hypothetical protein
MILVRDTFQAKYGQGDALVAHFQAYPIALPFKQRILTDASGSFFTVVTEYEVESLAEWERLLPTTFSDPAFPEWFAKQVTLVETGRREFFHIIE